jgi:hypothetical protein
MAFQPIPYPPTYSPAALGSIVYIMSAQGAKDLVEVSLINEINDGEINYTGTVAEFQPAFDALYAETLGNSGIGWSKQVPPWLAGLTKMGIGTQPPAPAGTYNK